MSKITIAAERLATEDELRDYAFGGPLPRSIPAGHRIEAHPCDKDDPAARLMELHDRAPVWAKLVVAPMTPLSQWEIDFCTGAPTTV